MMKPVLILLLVLSMLAVLGVLAAGLIGLFRGADARKSNKLMQYRVLFQAMALGLLALIVAARH